ncbi:MAG: outer membrane protein assembly factor BamC [Kiritimatiellia bacterium]|jgi:outer membrane protein assembly factor BamC
MTLFIMKPFLTTLILARSFAKTLSLNILLSGKTGRLFALVAAVLLLSACSSNENYLNANTLPPIAVPEGLDKQALGEIYAVPEGDGRLATGELRKPLPPSLSSAQVLTEPRIQSFAGKSWLVVPKEASATWSQLIIYMQSRKITSVKQDVYSASIETGWVTEAAESGTGLRYQLRLEPGLQPELTEIHAVNIKGDPSTSIIPASQWPAQSESIAHEEWLLKQIAKAMSNQQAVGDSLIASSISFPAKLISTSVDGEPVLEVSMGAEQIYAVIIDSVKAGAFTLYEQNPAHTVAYINKATKTKDKKKKFTEKVTGFLGDIVTAKFMDDKGASASLEDILSRLPNENEVNSLFPNQVKVPTSGTLSSLSGYLLVQRTIADNKQRIYIRDGYGRLLSSSQSKLLLDTLKKQLF